ncbi:MAG: Hsp20/alpha crystallin family protein [Bacteroidota bacterium]
MTGKEPEDYFKSFKDGLSDFGQKVNDVVDGFLSGDYMGSTFHVASDAYESDGYFWIEIELPGIKKEEVSIQVIEDELVVKGNKAISDEKERIYYQRERKLGDFIRHFELPENVKLEKIKASFDNGLLRVRFPLEKQEKEEDGDVKDVNID